MPVPAGPTINPSALGVTSLILAFPGSVLTYVAYAIVTNSSNFGWSQNVNCLRYLRPLLLALLTVLSTASCYLGTDAATRLAYDLKAGAAELRGSNKQEWVVEHRPASFPHGVHGDYEIILNAVDQARPRSGSLGVITIEGHRHGTSYHLNFVTVPKELRIHKKKGEPTYLTLRKTGVPNSRSLRGNQGIEVIAIR